MAQAQIAKYPLETASILHWDILWFLLKDEEFVSKTINDSNIDLKKFPASKMRQLAEKMESSKSNARHIKQVFKWPPSGSSYSYDASENRPPTKQEQVETTFPQAKIKEWEEVLKWTQDSRTTQQEKYLIQAKHTTEEIDVQSVAILNTLKILSVLQGSSSARPVVNMIIL